ncbi:type II secretion system F family protein [Alloalcanivorax marinus]|uniref:type II secretion system F family protein n=1 Tax=Alloalcanivorax marinus TaxID=1177169 RepID=UPI0019330EF1|nr:type II secretion system F family protein [Alloalcanivorax marinus]
MINLWFFAAMIMALLAVWVAWFMAPRWARKGRVHARLRNAGDVEAESSSFWLSRFATRLTESSLAREDFREMQEAFSATGRHREQSQVLYLVYCWLIPAIVVFGGFVFLGPMGGMLVAAGAFLLPRRTIRSMGRRAEQRQNIEAVELCHLTRMLMEAGLSLERVLRLIAAQGRPMIPMLAMRLDRFNRLMESGAERTQALDELGENRRIPVLRSYVVLMKQSSQLGAGVSDSLDQIIEEAQKVERNRIQEETNRIGAKMTVIMMAFMLPALFILIGGPAVISIGEALTG